MLVYLLICLSIVFFTLEHYVALKQHSKDQRMLPLVLGLAVLYMFYLIVEYITGASSVFLILKHLLLLEMCYLLFYYVLDFTKTSMPILVNLLIFFFIGVGNIFICFRISNGGRYKPFLLSVCGLFLTAIILYARKVIKSNKKMPRRLRTYIWLFSALTIPTIGTALVEVFDWSDMLIMPACLAVFGLIINTLMMTGKFYQAEEFLEENLFRSFDGMILLFDSDMSFIDASDKANERFAPVILDMNMHRMDYKYSDEFRDLISLNSPVHTFDYGERNYKAEFQPVSEKGDLKGYIMYIQDVTEEMNEVRDAREQTKLKSDFLANMSHELRSPLNAIIGGSDIVLKRGGVPESSRVMLGHISQAGNDLLQIVNSILDFSKLEANRLELKEKEYSLKRLCEKQTYNAVVNLKDKPVSFRLNISTPIPYTVLGDEARTEMILRNLLSNACKYTKEGSISCELSAEILENEKVKIKFSVSDTGSGMTKEQIEGAFNRYTSFADATIAETTGIGLYTVKQLCERMDGTVSVESDGKTGSTFTVTFIQRILSESLDSPCIMDESILKQEVYTDWQIVKPDFVYPEGKVLIVDDMRVNREVFLGKTKPWGFDCIEAECGPEAIEIAKKETPDLIFMDQMMPEMTGVEAAQKIKEFCNVPIVILTANTSDEMKAECADANLEGYAPKPIQIDEIKKHIERLMPESKRVIPDSNLMEINAQMIKTDPNYKYILEAYVEDIEEIVPLLKDYLENDHEMFRVKVHGIKGTSRQIGRFGIGDLSEVLEMAIKANHIPYIENHLDSYIEDLNIVINEVRGELETIGD